MIGKYDINPIIELYNKLDTELDFYLNMKYDLAKDRCYSNIDNMLKFILLNNGCKIDNEREQHQLIIDIIPNEYQLCFITGMIGNDVNEYYDFVLFNGMKILIIFIEYFNINKENEYIDTYKFEMGNSLYYDAIKKIIEVFYLTSEPIPNGLLATSIATTQRWNGAIIAIHILNRFKPIDDNDVCDISMDDIKKIIDGNIKLQLYGIRTM